MPMTGNWQKLHNSVSSNMPKKLLLTNFVIISSSMSIVKIISTSNWHIAKVLIWLIGMPEISSKSWWRWKQSKNNDEIPRVQVSSIITVACM